MFVPGQETGDARNVRARTGDAQNIASHPKQSVSIDLDSIKIRMSRDDTGCFLSNQVGMATEELESNMEKHSDAAAEEPSHG